MQENIIYCDFGNEQVLRGYDYAKISLTIQVLTLVQTICKSIGITLEELADSKKDLLDSEIVYPGQEMIEGLRTVQVTNMPLEVYLSTIVESFVRSKMKDIIRILNTK